MTQRKTYDYPTPYVFVRVYSRLLIQATDQNLDLLRQAHQPSALGLELLVIRHWLNTRRHGLC